MGMKVPNGPDHSPGRGYPDISFAGANYAVYTAEKYQLLSGTSASCSGVAGIFSNINAARIAAGKGSVGLLNPALYAHAHSFVNDVTHGHNRCIPSGVCCTDGYHATKGWDPVTGLGSFDYQKLLETFVSLGNARNSSPHTSTYSPPPLYSPFDYSAVPKLNASYPCTPYVKPAVAPLSDLPSGKQHPNDDPPQTSLKAVYTEIIPRHQHVRQNEHTFGNPKKVTSLSHYILHHIPHHFTLFLALSLYLSLFLSYSVYYPFCSGHERFN